MLVNIRKIGIGLMSLVLTIQFVLNPFQIKNVYALDDVEIFGEEVNFYVEETPIKKVITAVMEDGQEFSCEYINGTGKVYMNDHEIEYSFTEGVKVEQENDLSIGNANELYATTSDWTPETIITGYSIDFAPLIKATGTVAAIGTQIYTAMIGVSATTIINKLAKARLKAHWSAIADYCGDTIIDLIGLNSSKIVNVTFSYDLQKTKGLVDLTGSGVKVTAYRYANYTGKILVLGYTFSKNTGECGGWWSASKPYEIELPESKY